jgi:hypothetical protein
MTKLTLPTLPKGPRMTKTQSDQNLQANPVTKEIGSYAYTFFTRDNHYGPINLYDTKGILIGTIWFLLRLPTQETLPTPTIGADGVASLYYWTDAFTDLICLLRSEKFKQLICTGDDNSRILGADKQF